MAGKKIRKWLLDCEQAILAIESFLEDDPDFRAYQDNLMMRRAVEREFEILGEAVNRILHQQPDFPITDGRKIVNLRNHIIHKYDNVSDEIIWGIIHNNLPQLKVEIQRRLKSED